MNENGTHTITYYYTPTLIPTPTTPHTPTHNTHTRTQEKEQQMHGQVLDDAAVGVVRRWEERMACCLSALNVPSVLPDMHRTGSLMRLISSSVIHAICLNRGLCCTSVY